MCISECGCRVARTKTHVLALYFRLDTLFLRKRAKEVAPLFQCEYSHLNKSLRKILFCGFYALGGMYPFARWQAYQMQTRIPRVKYRLQLLSSFTKLTSERVPPDEISRGNVMTWEAERLRLQDASYDCIRPHRIFHKYYKSRLSYRYLFPKLRISPSSTAPRSLTPCVRSYSLLYTLLGHY